MNDRAPYGAAGGREEADIESPEQKDEFEPSLPPRQQPCPRRRPSCAIEDRVEGQDQGQQTRKGGSEANGSPTATPAHSMVPLDPATSGSEQPASSSADSQQTWPGPDFELKQVLPGSVYLWACGERDEEDENVSRPEFYAAWVVLIVSDAGSSVAESLTFFGAAERHKRRTAAVFELTENQLTTPLCIVPAP